MTALWLHLRTSSLRWILPPLIALAVMLLLLRPRYWIGIWPETGAAAQIPAFFLSIVAAGAAAWVSGSRTRHSMDEQTAAAAVPAGTSEAYRLGATAIILIIPYFAGHAVAFALTARSSPPGIHLWLLYAWMGIIVMLYSVAWGWVIGKFLSSLYASLVALLSWFLFESFVGDAVDLNVLSGPAWKEPDLGGLVVRSSAVVVFYAAVILATTRRTQGSMDWKRILISIVGAATAIMAVTSTTGISDRDSPDEPLCVAGKIEMCLWPENAKYASMVRALNVRVATLPAQFRLPPRLQEYGLERIQVTRYGETFTQLEGDFDISEGRKGALALGVSDAVIATTLRACNWEAIRQAEELAPEALRRWVELYLIESNIPEYGTSGVSTDIQESWSIAARVFTGMTDSQQRQWVHKELKRLETQYCA